MSHGKQFTLYTHASGPNGWKVAAVFEELGLTYESIYLDFGKGEHKAPEYTKYNPNGRIPAIVDHKNNDFTLWESGAIIVYLVDKYDPEHKVSAATENEKYEQLQWLMFQASGQGPYYGQSAWFQFFHKEKHPDAIERYNNEIKRVAGVLNGVLEKREYLVGGKPTVSDLAFVPWNVFAITGLLKDVDFEKEYPHFYKWHNRIVERDSFKKVYAVKASLA